MNLSSMRDIDAADPIGGLGRKIEPTPAPAPAPVRRPDGFVVHPDGTLSTDFAPPPGMAPSTPPHTPAPLPSPFPYPFRRPPILCLDPGAHGFLREPLKVGDRVRSLISGSVFTVVDATANDDGRIKVRRADGKVIPCRLLKEGKTWDRIPAPVAPERLKVGDMVRVLSGFYDAKRHGLVAPVEQIDGATFRIGSTTISGSAGLLVSEEGKTWERA